ncbi:type IV pilus assembly protein PilW [Acidovorax sp. 99]|uniref:prepilin-type N-terminal cleavage/methylation domain-containing protein n=1 Tax=Acidovorax sp. 99 TaxID=2135634 RepID=UPI000D5DAEB8|nr:PilW family protein [Acidovorax sp. 99]PVY89776.1 type IV pilus assembly protein PilW [Acidovorax sp. 99]
MKYRFKVFVITPDSTRRQRGVTLIELMVGIAVGLMVVAVALGALMASRGISGTVSEATSLQQQASYAFRVIGQQIRQAGSLELNLKPSIAPVASDAVAAMTAVAFDPPDPTGVRPPFSRASSTLVADTTPSFTVGYQNYIETVTPPAPASTPVSSSLLRDCLGQNPALAASGSLGATPVLSSKFQRNTTTNELVCVGTGGTSQPIIGNLTDMQLRYIQQAPNTTNLQYLAASSVIANAASATATWSNVYAVEVCLELTGTEPAPTAGATYTNCSGTATSYGDRLKMVFRNIYQIRSQGQV